MSSMVSIATPHRPTSPTDSGSSLSRPISVGRSNAVESPVFAAVLLVFAWARALGAGVADAALVSLAYATLPEVVVRSSYGGYYALSATSFLAAAWLAAEPRRPRDLAGVAGALAALANHKAIVVGAAAVVARVLRARVGATPVILGLVAGTAMFWAWGLAIAPGDFVGEHLQERLDGDPLVRGQDADGFGHVEVAHDAASSVSVMDWSSMVAGSTVVML